MSDMKEIHPIRDRPP